MKAQRRFEIKGGRSGFTLIELLVVITIILIVSAVTLPTVISSLNNRQVGESARILQAALSGARDAAIRADAPRGIRLLPDTSLFTAAFTDPDGNFHPGVLTYSRILPIEPGPDYNTGFAQIVSDQARLAAPTVYTYYSAYPYPNATYSQYPSGFDTADSNGYLTMGNRLTGKVLRLEECAFNGLVPHNPTSWWWNIRVGDKLRIDNSGQYYTVVGPLTVFPGSTNPLFVGQNPELFVNDGLPNDVRSNSGLQFDYGNGPVRIEFLYLVNGQDDDSDGYVDEGWDSINNDLSLYTGVFNTDDIVPDANNNFGEWETEQWLGSLSSLNSGMDTKMNIPYTITRRPVPSPSAREIALPGATVIDATTWNSTHERSRLPIDSNTLSVDIMVNQSGEVIPTLPYSTPASFNINSSFFHFWISDRSDVIDPVTNLGYPSLPTTEDAVNFDSTLHGTMFGLTGADYLKKDRVLLTLFTRSGLIVTNSVEVFDYADSDLPFRGAQLGTQEVK